MNIHTTKNLQQPPDSFRVALVSMPFVSMTRPSIQVGLLKSIAETHGFPTTALNFNLDFAHQIGPELYELLCQHRGFLLGDWLFSAAAFTSDAPDLECRFLDAFHLQISALLAPVDKSPEYLKIIRDIEVPIYLDALIDTIPWQEFRVVGFTSTFQQSIASFALATRIKQRYPHICTLFGGANFEGEMGLELVRTMQCIDYAVLGEGDSAFPQLLHALHEGRDPAEIPGVVCRREGEVTKLCIGPQLEHMDEACIPDYSEFFARAESLGLLPIGARRAVDIPFESARGCWWGQKQHCTFCGLNGMTMNFRAKSPERLINELTEQVSRYHSFQFEAVDNILNFSYLKLLFPRLIAMGTDYEFFYEVKANLSREKIKMLRDGGVRRIQPGIESLSSHVLKLMRKGTTAIQNVNTLRWSLYYGLNVNWNLIWGFPGETQEDYRQQLVLLRHLVHLQPPDSAGRIWMERFSPIYYDRQTFPARFIEPEASYAYVYPRFVRLNKVAYFFDYELEDTLPDSAYEVTAQWIQTWQAAWQDERRPMLTYWFSPGFLQIEDARIPPAPGTYTFVDSLASLYVACSNHPHSATELKEQLALPASVNEITEALDEFCSRGLMMREGNTFLSLALPANIER